MCILSIYVEKIGWRKIILKVLVGKTAKNGIFRYFSAENPLFEHFPPIESKNQQHQRVQRRKIGRFIYITFDSTMSGFWVKKSIFQVFSAQNQTVFWIVSKTTFQLS